MSIRSCISLHRLSAYVLTLLVSSSLVGKRAEAQATTPVVTASVASGLNHPTGWGIIEQTAIDTFGDWLVVDDAKGALYEFPANGGSVVTLVAPGGLGSGNNPGIAIDSANDLYLEGNWSNCLLRFPYDSATKTWDGLATLTPTNNSSSCAAPYNFAQYGLLSWNWGFQPWGIAVDANNNLVIGDQVGPFLFTLTVNGTGSTSTAGTATEIIDKMTVRADSVAVDKWGNIYFVEEPPPTSSGGLPGVYMIPAGQSNLSTDAGLTRVDPNLPDVTGVTTDGNGNLYIGDGKLGVFMVPNNGGTPNPSAAVMLTPVPPEGQVSIDWNRHIMYIPTGQTQTNGQADVAEVTFGAGELGSAATGATATTSLPVTFSFSTSVTPGSFVIQEAGAANPDFVIGSGGSCVAGTAQAAQSSCTVNVDLSPHAAGSVSAKLLMLDGSGNTLASIVLNGTGTGPAVQVSPGAESVIGSGLKTPSQVAVDANQNVYVADSGLGAVEMYAKGSTGAATSVGTGLTAPTGVAVDGAGDVFIADSGNVIEVPAGTAGLNAAGQVTLKTGLGTNLKLAVDGVGDLYVSDPSNHRVVELGSVGGTFSVYSQTETDLTGFSSPSALAVDQNQNLYVADGSNLYQVTPSGTQTTLLNSLPNATGLAVDPSESVYVATAGGTLRIPNESGTLNPADAVTVATNVTNPTSVALDQADNLYITDGTAEDVQVVSASASTNFGTQSNPTASVPPATYTILNIGNSPLTITGFAGTADFSETATTCTGGAVAVEGSCSVTVTFSPGPGDQGNLSGQVLITGNEANIPVGISGVGVGAALANSKTAVSVTSPTVDGAPAAVTVTPASGSGTPTGQVTLTITGSSLTAPVVVTGTLSNGKVTLAPPQLAAGTYTYAISYQGDRTYGTSTASMQVTIAPGAVTIVQPTIAQFQAVDPWYPYVLAIGSGSNEPYDGSADTYENMGNYEVTVAATDGAPLIGQPIYNAQGKQVATNYGSITFQGASSNCTSIPVAANGTATFATDCFTINTTNSSLPNILTPYTVTPVYSPAGAGSSLGNTNPNYTSTTGTSISFTALRNPVVQIASNPSSLSITPGSSASATLTLSSVLGYGVAGAGALLNNYSLPVQLACDGLPAYATCSFTYNTNVDPSDSQSVDVGPPAGSSVTYEGTTYTNCTSAHGCYGPATVTMTINTNISTGDVASLDRHSTGTTFAAMFGLGLLGLVFGKKRSLRARALTLVCLLLVTSVIAGVTGCSTTQLGTTTGTPTPAGTYTVTVTAKQVGSQTITQTPGIVYGNQNQMSLPFTMQVTIQ